MSEEKNISEKWKEKLTNIYNRLETESFWARKKWKKVETIVKNDGKEWKEKWEKLGDKLKKVDDYWKNKDSNCDSLVVWIRNKFPGSYGMSDQPCYLFGDCSKKIENGKERKYNIEDAKKEEKKNPSFMIPYAQYFSDCLNQTDSSNIDQKVSNKSINFYASAVLNKLIIANQYFSDKFNYVCFYNSEKIEKLQKMMQVGEDSVTDKNFFSCNEKIFKKAKEVIKLDKIDLIQALRLTEALDILMSPTSPGDFPTESQPNIIYYGAPGTGKTYAVKNIIDLVCQGDSNRYVWTQFHPNFSYEDFIDGIKPTGIDKNGNVKLELLNGLFKDLCIRAKNDIDHEYYFIADEINRANLSAVFGETLSLLEASYRDDPEKDNRNNLIKTQYSKVESKLIEDKVIDEKIAYEYDEEQGARFGIPKNIRFIGMMNDVDKSIDAFDLALRRRFKWIRKDCDYNVIEETVKGDIDKIDKNSLDSYIKSCKNLNKFISVNEKGLKLGKSYEFGHSFFMKISDIVKNNKKEDAYKITVENKETLFDNYLSPTLKEYLRSSCSEEEIEGKEGKLQKAKEAFVKEQEKPGEEAQLMTSSVPQAK